MLIEIYSDVICPWCFIGKRRLERAMAQRPSLDITIDWRAFQLNPWMPAEGMERKAYLEAKFGSRDAARVYDGIKRVGEGEGIDFRFDRIPRTPNTLSAHRLIRMAGAQQKQDAVVEALFQAYFINGRDIGSIDSLAEIAGEAGLDRDEIRRSLADEGDLQVVRAEDARARQMGIQGVPCFIVDRSYAVSGAQEPEYFLPVFDLARNGKAVA